MMRAGAGAYHDDHYTKNRFRSEPEREREPERELELELEPEPELELERIMTGDELR